jgi:putative oxidoreductase
VVLLSVAQAPRLAHAGQGSFITTTMMPRSTRLSNKTLMTLENAFVGACSMVVGVTLLYAGVTKLLGFPEFAKTLRSFPIARSLVRSPRAAMAGAIAISVVEVCGGLALASGLMPGLSGPVAASLLLAFSVGLLLALIHGEAISCGCFGEKSDDPVRWSTLMRGLSLSAAALIGSREGGTTPAAWVRGDVATNDFAPFVFILIQAALLVGLLASFLRIRKQHGYATERQPAKQKVGEAWEGIREARKRQAVRS